MKTLTVALIFVACTSSLLVKAQPCTPLGNQTSYGTNNVWIGYVYNTMNFTAYRSYVNEGTAGDPSFNQSFGGSNVTYTTNGCSITTETFSVRYKLTKTFTNGNYAFTVGGDDGYRLSIDGGATWLIDRWFDQGYNTTTAISLLNGTYNLVLEFYENTGGNQVSFQVQATCLGTGNPAVYGTNNVWRGYVYEGTNFSVYQGDVTEGTAGSPNFDQSFGGTNTMYNTNTCAVQTETLSVRYRLRKTFANGNYIFQLGGDDGYRFSLDGGSTWVINQWTDQSYNTTSYNAILNGTYDMVIEYYENSGDNRISFDMTGSILPVRLLQFTGSLNGGLAELKWILAAGSNPKNFEVERSADGQHFQVIGSVTTNTNTANHFHYADKGVLTGISYYRLKISDLDGNENYSQIITISNHLPEGIKIFPTIVQNNTVFIRSQKSLQNVAVNVYDISGKKLSNQHFRSIISGQTISITMLKGMSPGTYFVEAKSEKGQQAKKLVIVQ